MFHVGQWIEDQYLVLEKHCTRCWVEYIVQDRVSENMFVVKRLSDIVLSNKSAAIRFTGKAKVWISLGENDELVNAFMVKEYEGFAHLFVEYVSGPSLAMLFHAHSGKAFPLPQTLALMKHLIEGMRFLHSAGLADGGSNVIHGGLNPHAILMAHENFKITDIGLASVVRQSYEGKNISLLLDELPYLAPEQLNDPGKANELSDIYAFGAIVYQAATGTAPIVGRTSQDALHEFVAHNYVSPRVRNRGCPQWLEEMVLKCLTKEPENRFQSFAHIDGFLTNVLKDQEILATDDKVEDKEENISRVAKVRGIAKKESRRLNHYYLGVEHLMLGLLAEEESLVVSCLGDAFTAAQLRSEILSRLPKGEGPWYWDGIAKTPRYSRVMSRARRIRKKYGHARMLPHHVLLAILEEGKNVPVRALREMHIDLKAAVGILRRELQQHTPALFNEETENPFGRFCQKVVCRRYLPGAIPFAGRGEELQKAIHAVTDLFKSIIVVGEPGAGKSAFVQELECHLQKSFSDSGLNYGGLYELKKGAIFGKDEDNEEPGANFQNLITAIIATNALLLIEGLEVFLGMGFRTRAISFAETLETQLPSNQLVIVATTTPEGLLSCEMESKGIMSNFEVILLPGLSPELMLNILSSARENLEAEHSLTIEDGALAALLDLPYQMGNLVLPAKAIEVLEHLCFLAKASEKPGQRVNIDADAVADFIQVHL